MSALISRPVMALERFRKDHGDVATWSSADWEVHLNLAEIALAHGPIGGLRQKASRRTAAVVVFGYIFALYAVTELTSAIRGPKPGRLDYHLAYVVRGPARRADERLRSSGELVFRQQLLRFALRYNGAVERLAARIARH